MSICCPFRSFPILPSSEICSFSLALAADPLPQASYAANTIIYRDFGLDMSVIRFSKSGSAKIMLRTMPMTFFRSLISFDVQRRV